MIPEPDRKGTACDLPPRGFAQIRLMTWSGLDEMIVQGPPRRNVAQVPIRNDGERAWTYGTIWVRPGPTERTVGASNFGGRCSEIQMRPVYRGAPHGGRRREQALTVEHHRQAGPIRPRTAYGDEPGPPLSG